MGCQREAVLKVPVKLERSPARKLRDPECRRIALEEVALHKLELEDLLAEEPTYSRA